MKTENYEITPIQIGLKGIPTVAAADTIENSKTISVQGVTTLPSSAKEAHLRSQSLLKRVRQRIRQGDHQALVDLLDDHPEFSAHPWVRDELLKWRRTERSFRKRGRKVGSFRFHPLVIAGVVEELKERGWATTDDAAFEWLAHNWPIAYDTARDKYYRARREERFKAVLIENPIGANTRTAAEIEEIIDQAETLETGSTITRTVETSEGPFTITFQGL